SWGHKLHGHEATSPSARPDGAGDSATRARRRRDPVPAGRSDRGAGRVRPRVRGTVPAGGTDRPAPQRAPALYAVLARPRRDRARALVPLPARPPLRGGPVAGPRAAAAAAA